MSWTHGSVNFGCETFRFSVCGLCDWMWEGNILYLVMSPVTGGVQLHLHHLCDKIVIAINLTLILRIFLLDLSEECWNTEL